MDEKTLVERSQDGRRDAFEELVRMYNQKVFALAYGFVRDRAAADDLAQEIFLKAYQALPSFRAESRVRDSDPDRRFPSIPGPPHAA